jgi:hypothetical protein
MDLNCAPQLMSARDLTPRIGGYVPIQDGAADLG